MTEKQKKAIKVLNELVERCGEDLFNDDDYFLLLDFVVGDTTYVPTPLPLEGLRRTWEDMSPVMYSPPSFSTTDRT